MSEHQPYYETMYILRPDIAEEEVESHLKKYSETLTSAGGEVLDNQMRGKRRLAYTIGKNKEGIYVQLSHRGDGQHVAVLEKAMRLSEDVIRYLTVKQDGPLPVRKNSKNNDKEEKATNDKNEKTESQETPKEDSKAKSKDEPKKIESDEKKESTDEEKE